MTANSKFKVSIAVLLVLSILAFIIKNYVYNKIITGDNLMFAISIVLGVILIAVSAYSNALRNKATSSLIVNIIFIIVILITIIAIIK